MTTIQRITARERAYVQEVLDAQFHTSAGSMMSTRLERQFAEKFQSKYAISFINGTATMHAALVAAGVVSYFGMLLLLGFRLRDFNRKALS